MVWRSTYVPHLLVREPVMMPNDWVDEMVVYLAECAHQVVELTVKQHYPVWMPSQDWWQPGGSVWSDGTPVHLTWGSQSDLASNFYGYVASSRVVGSERDEAYQHIVQVTVVYTLVGASMPMQTRRNRVWPDTTLSAVAREIAREYNLQPRVQTSDVRFEQRMQTSSDWAFLAEICDHIGYRLYVDESAMWFVTRETIQPTGDARIPTFELWKTRGSFNSLRAFESTAGDTDPVGGVRAKYATVALNRRSGVLTSATYTQPRSKPPSLDQRAPLLMRQWENRPSVSWGKASSNMSAEVEWLWVEAKATVTGDSRLRPGAVVELGGNGIGTESAGRWMVRSVVHRFKPNWPYMINSNYVCDLVLGRNQVDRLVLPVQAQVPRFGETTLVGGRWRAVYEESPW